MLPSLFPFSAILVLGVSRISFRSSGLIPPLLVPHSPDKNIFKALNASHGKLYPYPILVGEVVCGESSGGQCLYIGSLSSQVFLLLSRDTLLLSLEIPQGMKRAKEAAQFLSL